MRREGAISLRTKRLAGKFVETKFYAVCLSPRQKGAVAVKAEAKAVRKVAMNSGILPLLNKNKKIPIYKSYFFCLFSFKNANISHPCFLILRPGGFLISNSKIGLFSFSAKRKPFCSCYIQPF
jgi:hypothetical protein